MAKFVCFLNAFVVILFAKFRKTIEKIVSRNINSKTISRRNKIYDAGWKKIATFNKIFNLKH